MKLELQYPYSTTWRKGYLVTNKENRRNVILFNSRTDRTTVSYARYLVSCREKRWLSSDEEVDHVDGDKTNDDISNLQILSVADHLLKTTAERRTGIQLFYFVCPTCNKVFARPKRNSHHVSPACSRSCGGKKSANKVCRNSLP